MLRVDGNLTADDAVVNTLAVEEKTTFKGLVDFSNSSIPTLRVDGNLTADDAVVNTLAVEEKTTFKGHVDFSNSYIPTLRVDGNVTLNGDGKTRSLYIGADVDGAQSVATIRLGDQASSKVYVGASIQPMQVFPTALLPSDGAVENIKVIANGHGFRDMDIVYISNSADAAGDAAPLTPSGNGFSTSKAPRKTLFTSTTAWPLWLNMTMCNLQS